MCLHSTPSIELLTDIEVIFYMHRMIACLGAEVLEFVPSVINILIPSCGLKDFVELVRLINQIMSKFKVICIQYFVKFRNKL